MATKNTGPTNSAGGGAKPTLVVTQTGSPIGRAPDQRATLIGLGLNRRHRTRTLEDTQAVRGMINKVRHLVRILETVEPRTKAR